MRLYIYRFLGKKIDGLAMHEVYQLLKEAQFVQKIEIDTMAAAIAKCLGGDKG